MAGYLDKYLPQAIRCGRTFVFQSNTVLPWWRNLAQALYVASLNGTRIYSAEDQDGDLDCRYTSAHSAFCLQAHARRPHQPYHRPSSVANLVNIAHFTICAHFANFIDFTDFTNFMSFLHFMTSWTSCTSRASWTSRALPALGDTVLPQGQTGSPDRYI